MIMNDLISIKLDRDAATPLYQQLGDALCVLIEEGVFKPNAKLPPIRVMAKALHVNNTTVVNAYKYLENKKVVYSHIGSGTYVTDSYTIELPEPVDKSLFNTRKNAALNTQKPYAHPDWPLGTHSGAWQPDARRYSTRPYGQRNYPSGSGIKSGGGDVINFASSSTSTDLFPVSEFKLIFNQILDRDKGDAFQYQESQGYEPLRRAICGYLSGYGIKTSADKVQIISGAQQGIDIVSKVMLSMGDVVFVEKPTFYGAVGAFISRGGQVVELTMEKDGMDMNMLESMLKIYKPRFIYVMTYFQTPTCCCYSMDKKRRLLELAAKYDTYIVEEDNQSEFIYNNQPVLPLKAIDYKNRVIYIKSFSKILMPGLRIGFMVLPKKILQQVLSVKYTTDIATSGFIQRAFEAYLKSPEWEKHIIYMKSILKARYQTTRESIDKYLSKYVRYNHPEGGLSFWLELKSNKTSMEELCNRIAGKNVLITPGAVFSVSGEDIPFFRLSFASAEEWQIGGAVKIIGETLGE